MQVGLLAGAVVRGQTSTRVSDACTCALHRLPLTGHQGDEHAIQHHECHQCRQEHESQCCTAQEHAVGQGAIPRLPSKAVSALLRTLPGGNRGCRRHRRLGVAHGRVALLLHARYDEAVATPEFLATIMVWVQQPQMVNVSCTQPAPAAESMSSERACPAASLVSVMGRKWGHL